MEKITEKPELTPAQRMHSRYNAVLCCAYAHTMDPLPQYYKNAERVLDILRKLLTVDDMDRNCSDLTTSNITDTSRRISHSMAIKPRIIIIFDPVPSY